MGSTSASLNLIPKAQIIEEALWALECAMTAILEEEGPSQKSVDQAFDTLAGQGGGYLLSVYRQRFTGAMFHAAYDPATRFRATEGTLELIKRHLGR